MRLGRWQLLALCDGGQASEFAVAIGGTADAEGAGGHGSPRRD